MEALDRAVAREEAARLAKLATKPITIKSLNDIKAALGEFDPKHQANDSVATVRTTVDTVIDGKPAHYSLSVDTRSRSKREMLLDGFQILKNRVAAVGLIQAKVEEPIEVNGVPVARPKIGNAIEGVSWLDPLIKAWLGGYREGLYVCWTLDGVVYKYDIFEHKLLR